jgi:hypothetical protein
MISGESFQIAAERFREGNYRLVFVLAPAIRTNRRDGCREPTLLRIRNERDRQEHIGFGRDVVDERQRGAIEFEELPLFVRHGEHLHSLHRIHHQIYFPGRRITPLDVGWRGSGEQGIPARKCFTHLIMDTAALGQSADEWRFSAPGCTLLPSWLSRTPHFN